MTLTTLPAHLKPMVEKAAEKNFHSWCQLNGYMAYESDDPWKACPSDVQQRWIEETEFTFVNLLNACLDGGVAREAGGTTWNHGSLFKAQENATFFGADAFRALILNLGGGK